MLVLSRNLNESIRINDIITITVLGIRGGNVRLGIEAPSDMLILRQELDQPPAVSGGKEELAVA